MKARWALLLLLAGCGKEPDRPTVPENGGGPPEIPPLPAVQAAQPEWTRRESVTELEPGGETAFAWNLADTAHFAYALVQHTQLASTATSKGQALEMKVRSKLDGYVEIVGGGNGRAELRYKRTLREQVQDGQAVPPAKINEDKPSLFQGILLEDGKIQSLSKLSGNAESPYLDFLCALPSKPLSPGGTSEVAVHFGTNVDDYGYHGRVVFRHAGRAKVGRRECVRLESVVDLELASPRAMETKGRLVGRVTAYFDPAGRCLTALDAALTLLAHSRALVSPPEGKGPPFWTVGRSQCDSQIGLRLKED